MPEGDECCREKVATEGRQVPCGVGVCGAKSRGPGWPRAPSTVTRLPVPVTAVGTWDSHVDGRAKMPVFVELMLYWGRRGPAVTAVSKLCGEEGAPQWKGW